MTLIAAILAGAAYLYFTMPALRLQRAMTAGDAYRRAKRSPSADSSASAKNTTIQVFVCLEIFMAGLF